MASSTISRKNGEHYRWGDRSGTDCDGWHLVRSPGLSVIQERMPAGTAERRHYHAKARQFFFVLRGELTIETEGTEHTLGPETGIEIPPGRSHQVMNRSSEEAEFLVISSPPSRGDRINEE